MPHNVLLHYLACVDLYEYFVLLFGFMQYSTLLPPLLL